MVAATDGAELPVPYGEIGGVVDEFGRPVDIAEDAPVQAYPYGNGYQVTVDALPPGESQGEEFLKDLSAEALESLAEKVLLQGAPKAIEFGLGFLGVVADLLTATPTIRETYIRGEYNGVPVTYLILSGR
jgi:hypothetical protein